MSQIRLYFETSEKKAKEINAIFEIDFEEDGYPVAIFEVDEEKAIWAVSVYSPEENATETGNRIQEVLKNLDYSANIEQEKLEDYGWIEKTLSDLVPVRAGRFLVHGSHDKDSVKPSDIGILVDAGLAFGTGHHGTTAGCLEMIGAELKSGHFRNALDLGAGSGVLAIAVAKAKRIPVLASDIDPIAMEVCNQNARINGVSKFVKSITAVGFNHNEFSKYVPFDLVIANILASPLQKLAFDMSRHLSDDAIVILSGLLPNQKARIVSSYRAQGLALKKAYIRDGWLTLVLRNIRR